MRRRRGPIFWGICALTVTLVVVALVQHSEQGVLYALIRLLRLAS